MSTERGHWCSEKGRGEEGGGGEVHSLQRAETRRGGGGDAGGAVTLPIGLSQANQAGSVRRVEGESSGNVKKINVNMFISHIHTCTCRRLQ